jgi:hypothetical protein
MTLTRAEVRRDFLISLVSEQISPLAFESRTS